MSIETLKAEVARRFGTPAVVVDLDVVERNIARVQALCDAAGIANRPHIKTHKSPVIAAMQRKAGARGITCQKLGEAEVMADAGHDDILIAYIVRIPVLRNPLMHMRTYSHDRYAAYLAPDSVRGLVALASGRRVLSHVDVDVFLHEALEEHGWRARAASFAHGLPRVAYRVQALARAGLLRHDTLVSGPPSDSRPVVQHG